MSGSESRYQRWYKLMLTLLTKFFFCINLNKLHQRVRKEIYYQICNSVGRHRHLNDIFVFFNLEDFSNSCFFRKMLFLRYKKTFRWLLLPFGNVSSTFVYFKGKIVDILEAFFLVKVQRETHQQTMNAAGLSCQIIGSDLNVFSAAATAVALRCLSAAKA